MILVDSSVWIDYFRSVDTRQVALLDTLFGHTPLAVGDLIAAEVLQGVRDEKAFKWVKRTLDAFEHVDLCGYDLAVRAAENYRALQAKGVTIRSTIDCVIAQLCLRDGQALLAKDRDFDRIAELTKLKLVEVDSALSQLMRLRTTHEPLDDLGIPRVGTSRQRGKA